MTPTPTPPSTNSSAGGRSPEDQFRVVRKRNRVPLSCYPCRTRKKCDRSHPCGNCTRREGNHTTVCSYASPSSRKKSQALSEAGPDDMQGRIDRLEGLVLSLMHGGGNVDPASAVAAASIANSAKNSRSMTDSGSSAKAERDDEALMIDGEVEEESDDEEELANSLGVLKVDADKGKSMYIGHEHWHLILADIAEVKSYFTHHKKELEKGYERVRSSKPTAEREGPTLLLGAVPALELEIRAELPQKSTVLALCSRYFNSMDNAVSIIHRPTFQQQLKTHWQDPSKTPIMWLGLLYSILTLAMLSYYKVGDEPPEWKGRVLELAAEYRLRTVQCLVKADYTKPVEYTIETMVLYVFGEYSSRWDAELGLWLIVSIITRTALRMGYHRDAKWFPSLSPFQVEMRRRTWALVRMCDIIFSHQVSLPSMIYEHDCDTQLPNNLPDEDFGPDIKELPAPRPDTAATPISYMIAKAKLCFELGNILQVTNRVGKQVPYDEIIRFDAKLRQLMQELPPHLKVSPLEGSQDPVTLIIARFNIEILYLKIVCLLHRKYLPKARQNPRYAHSRRSAIEASLAALDRLVMLHREAGPGGRLRSIHWFIKSIATKDFVLPAMLIILDLHFDNIAEQSAQSTDAEGSFLWSSTERRTMITTLQEAQRIWVAQADTSMEAFKAAKVIDIMLKKIDTPEASSEVPGAVASNLASDMGIDPSPSMGQDIASPPYTTGGGFAPNTMNPFADGNSASLGMDFSFTPSTVPEIGQDVFGVAYPTPMSMWPNMQGNAGGLPDLTGNFDWGAFESYTQMANWGTDQTFYGVGDTMDQQHMAETTKGQ